MIYLIMYLIVSIMVLFFAILEDKKSKPLNKWFTFLVFILYFWLIVPHYLWKYYINNMRDKQEMKRKEEYE